MKKDGTWYVAMSGDGDGWPDYFALRDKRVIWMEIKSEDGQLSPEQYFWLKDLQDAGQEAYLSKPSDWEEIVELIQKA